MSVELDELELEILNVFRKFAPTKKHKLSAQFCFEYILIASDSKELREMEEEACFNKINDALISMVEKKIFKKCYIKNRGTRKDDTEGVDPGSSRLVSYKFI